MGPSLRLSNMNRKPIGARNRNIRPNEGYKKGMNLRLPELNGATIPEEKRMYSTKGGWPNIQLRRNNIVSNGEERLIKFG